MTNVMEMFQPQDSDPNVAAINEDLNHLERLGYITSFYSEDGEKRYAITDKGLQQYKAQTGELNV